MQTVRTMKATRMKSYDRYKEQKWENFKEKLDYMKNTVDPLYLLNDLGVDTSHQTTKEIRCACPVHGGDNRTAFRFNKETRTWVCFTHKCHEVFGNDIIGLVKALTGRDFVRAVDYLRDLTGEVSGVDYVEHKRRREMEEFIHSYDTIKMRPESVNEASLSKFKELRSSYFLRQGFSQDTLDYFEIAGGWKDKHGLIRDIIPIRNSQGELMAYSLRDIRDSIDDDDFKYILTPGFDKQNCLYNLNRAQEYGDRLPIIVVEGFKSVWRLHEYGIDNVVCTMGAGITTGQQYLLFMYAMKGIVTFFDNDKAGVEATNKACEDLKHKLDVYPVFIQELDDDGKGLDPADLTKDQVYEYLATYF